MVTPITGICLTMLLGKIAAEKRHVRAVCVSLWVLVVFLMMPVLQADAQYLGGPPPSRNRIPLAIDDTGETMRELLAASPPPVLIATGDELNVEVFEIDHYKYTVRVGADGNITLPLVDSVEVKGLSPDDAERSIAHRLEAAGMVRNPHLHINFVQAPTRQFTVSGNVEKPGVFPSFGSNTLIGAIAIAGGLKEDASSNVTLIRPGTLGGVVVNLGANPQTSVAARIPVYSGDTVIAGAVGVYYVVGAVKTSGAYKLKSSSPTTVGQALATAGGVGFEGERDHLEIVRFINGTAIEIAVRLPDKKGEPMDITALQPDDILFVPTSALRASLKGGAASIAAVLASAALYKF